MLETLLVEAGVDSVRDVYFDDSKSYLYLIHVGDRDSAGRGYLQMSTNLLTQEALDALWGEFEHMIYDESIDDYTLVENYYKLAYMYVKTYQ